jgi:hypothetical protein
LTNVSGDASRTRRIAHFLLKPELSCSPPNEALISAYLELGYAVDLYAPGGDCRTDYYGAAVSTRGVDYGRRWLLRHAWRPKWSQYSAFSGTSEDPLAIVGLLAAINRRPAIALADEIKTGSYYGDRSERWKRLCRFGMRRAKLNIVNEAERIALQRDYARLSTGHEVAIYPGGYRNPPTPVNRSEQRRKWGIPESALVIGASGGFNLSAGADWLIDALGNPDLYAVIQPLGVDPLSLYLLGRVKGCERAYVEKKRLGWREAWAQAASIDIGVVVYKNQAPQFQHMGTSSNRLCMFLGMGVPVIASRQPSFRFLEDYRCGVLVDDSINFSRAIAQISASLSEMKANAVRCWREYVATPQRYDELVIMLRKMLHVR